MLSLLLLFAFLVGTICSEPDLSNDETKRILKDLGEYFNDKADEIMTKNKYKLKKNKAIITQSNPPRYVMNVEDPVDVRWGQLCTDHADAYVTMYEHFDAILSSMGADDVFYPLGLYWYQFFVPEQYKEEIAFFAECTGIPLHGAITLNLMEAFVILGCTTIIGVDEENTVFQGRNLDLWLGVLQDVVQSASFIAEYRSEGEPLFEAYTFFGFSGILQGVKPAKFSLAANLRYADLTVSLNGLLLGYRPFTWVIRDILSNSASNYQSAFTQLTEISLFTPAYFSIAGLSYPDGAVIARDYTEVVKVITLDNTDLEWFIAVTNHDWWDVNDTLFGGPAHKLESSKNRRQSAIDNMNILTRSDLNAYSMFTVMSQVPTINFGTVSISVFSPSKVANQQKMHKTRVVTLHEPGEGQEVFVYPSDYLNWTTVFVVVLLVSVSLNIAMCIGRFLYAKPKTKYYSKVPQEMMKFEVIGADLDDDTEDEQM